MKICLERKVLSFHLNLKNRLGITFIRSQSKSACNEAVHKFLTAYPIGHIFRAKNGKQKLIELHNMLQNIDNVNELTTTKRFMGRKFGNLYSVLLFKLTQISDKPNFVRMLMILRYGENQRQAFQNCLFDIVSDKSLTNDLKITELYQVISIQNQLFPLVSKNSPVVLPTAIHKWFLTNLTKEQYPSHYLFLIENNVNLSSCVFIHELRSRLLNGNIENLRLVTFQRFLINGQKDVFMDKFIKLYDFEIIIQLFSLLLKKKDFRYVEYYFAALLKTLQIDSKFHKVKPSDGISISESKLIQFHDLMLYYISQQGTIPMFIRFFNTQIEFINNIKGLNENCKLKLLHKSLHMLLHMLNKHSKQDEILGIISMISKNKNFNSKDLQQKIFSRYIMQELINMVSTFEDPKLTCKYILSMHSIKPTLKILNNLGLWHGIFHNKPLILSDNQLTEEIESIKGLLPVNKRINLIPSIFELVELYKVLLKSNAKLLSKSDFRTFIFGLYSNFKSLQSSKIKDSILILNIILYHIRYSLKDNSLAVDILIDYFNQEKIPYMTHIYATKCPFSIVLYGNHLSQSKINIIEELIERHKYPLTFEICISMVFHYINLRQEEKAHAWYKQIITKGYELRHFGLIQLIKEKIWELPTNTTIKMLEEKQNSDDNGLEEIIPTDEWDNRSSSLIDVDLELKKLIEAFTSTVSVSESV
ncbi:hypothetical protein TBLA_0A03560 [Henningerozyma blattae CBS 6284]|uniref:Mitochondrial translation factor ATP22 n=1 Tax=Henningerozyma blattae (strain ATCC 34711 / CBS 6284 / DSM 70876 / NBRC 10599 / NRRL Y-10934 / UCD 77-7) TaxID=1071380 RepID=I2GVK3_HENB6|nr:hypothetical protein TBLA_0A03560 [Tetrapisispora blattae CBS 6284]CCH58155.1 hypothetical protein TBLA_0A03560 [Tetrapisispora blattae CBS 6284]